MKFALLFGAFVFAAFLKPALAGDSKVILRVARVLEKGAENVELMTLVRGEEKEELHVSKESIVTDKDVEDAWPQQQGNTVQIGIKLNEAGADRMGEATAGMDLGKDRLAVIMEGELVMAPTVNDRLKGNFVVMLGRDGDFNEASHLAQRILGEEPVKEAADRPIPKLPETRPYTEDEYQELKRQREEIGLHYLDAIPSEAELDKLNKGTTEQEVIKVMGTPSRRSAYEDRFLGLDYDCAPERLPLNPEGEMRPIGVRLHFDPETKTYRSWSYTTGDMPRERKVVGRADPLLKVVMPEMDVRDPDFDFLILITETQIPDLNQKIGHRDLYDLLSVIGNVSSVYREDLGRTLPSDCDVVRFLAQYLPEFQRVVDGAEGGKTSLKQLKEAAHPYMWDGKELPKLEEAENPDGVGESR